MYGFMLFWLVFIASGRWGLPIISGIVTMVVLLHLIYWSTAIVAGLAVILVVRSIQALIVVMGPWR